MKKTADPQDTERRIALVSALVRRQITHHLDTSATEYMSDAVRALCTDYLIDAKFDRILLKEWMQIDGWTDEDFTWFGISDIFEEEE